MRAGEIASRLREILGPKALRIETPTERRVFLTARAGDLEDVMRAVMGLAREARFMTISAVDEGLDVELLYHVDVRGTIITVRVKVPKEEMRVPDISRIAPAAEFIEREIRDLFGVEFAGLRPEKLYTPEGYEEKPLLKPREGPLPPQARPVAEALMGTGCATAISKTIMRRREKMGLPPTPPGACASPEATRELREMAEAINFAKRAGYDVKKGRLRYR